MIILRHIAYSPTQIVVSLSDPGEGGFMMSPRRLVETQIAPMLAPEALIVLRGPEEARREVVEELAAVVPEPCATWILEEAIP